MGTVGLAQTAGSQDTGSQDTGWQGTGFGSADLRGAGSQDTGFDSGTAGFGFGTAGFAADNIQRSVAAVLVDTVDTLEYRSRLVDEQLVLEAILASLDRTVDQPTVDRLLAPHVDPGNRVPFRLLFVHLLGSHFGRFGLSFGRLHG